MTDDDRRTTARLDPARLTMYDNGDKPPQFDNQYPDWNEATTRTFVGPIGGAKVRGKAFIDFNEAKAYYEGRFGPAVERHFWPFPEQGGGKYGFRFRTSVVERVLKEEAAREA